jgi:hypothetical protein
MEVIKMFSYGDDEPMEDNERIAGQIAAACADRTKYNGWRIEEKVFLLSFAFFSLFYVLSIAAPLYGYRAPPPAWTTCFFVAVVVYAGTHGWAWFCDWFCKRLGSNETREGEEHKMSVVDDEAPLDTGSAANAEAGKKATKDNGPEPNNGRPLKERVFFWSFFAVTILHIFMIVAPTFGYNAPPSAWTKCYLVTLGVYAGVRKWAQFGKKMNNKRRGEFFVILYLFVAVAMVFFQVISTRPDFTICGELWSTVLGVILIYGGADILKRIGESDFGKLIKKAIEKYIEED